MTALRGGDPAAVLLSAGFAKFARPKSKDLSNLTMAFTRIISQAHLPATDEARNFPCNGKMICIVNTSGTLSAMDNECLHQGGSLGQGMVEDGKVVCPWHAWKYDPKTGVAVDHPDMKLKTYPIKVEDGEVYIDI